MLLHKSQFFIVALTTKPSNVSSQFWRDARRRHEKRGAAPRDRLISRSEFAMCNLMVAFRWACP